MKIKYLPQDNEARINNGICRYNGHPYHLDLISQTKALLSPLHAGSKEQRKEVNLSDELLDISSPPLGWMNVKSDAVYVLRRPERNYKQTIRPNVLSGYLPGNNNQVRAGDLHSYIYSEYGENMFLGKYPDVKAVCSWMSGKRRSAAISRDVCLYRDPNDNAIHVLHKLEDVGKLDLLSNTVDIPKAELAWIPSLYLQQFDWKVN